MPQKPHVPTDEKRRVVRTMAAHGVPQEDIATVVDCSDVTLRRYYRGELGRAAIEANAKVAENLFRIATDTEDNKAAVTAAIFWLKCRAGWRETEHAATAVTTIVMSPVDAAL